VRRDRRRPHRHPAELGAERARETRAHCFAEICDPRPFADQDAVGVDELEAARAHELVGPLQEPDRRDVEPLRVARREELADVAAAGGAEDRVDEGVRDHIAVRVPYEPRLAGKIDAGED
jgi:hypothetical protein